MSKNHSFSKSHRWGKKQTLGPTHARKHIAVNGLVLMLAGVLGAATRAIRKQRKEKGRNRLENLKGKVGILESYKGSNTPEGQRPGESF